MTGKPRILLCWEAGANRGHVLTLAGVAKALSGQASFQARLCRMDHASVLAPYCADISRGWPLKHQKLSAEAAEKAAQFKLTWATWLRARGYDDWYFLRAAFQWWCDTIWEVRPAMVVGDYAPTALMAARALGIPSLAVGHVYGLPPSDMTCFPVIGRHDAPLQLDQDAFCARINDALGPIGLPTLDWLPQVYQSTLTFPHGLSLCDPYAEWRTQPPLSPFDSMPDLNSRRGDVLFAYIPAKEVRKKTILTTLRQVALPTVLVSPFLDDPTRAILKQNPMLDIRLTPLPMNEIVARARMILCLGQGGTTALAVLSGLPCLALPSDQEKDSNATRAAVLPSFRRIAKADRSAERILTVLHEMWNDTSLQDAARESAVRLRKADVPLRGNALRRIVSRLLLQGALSGSTKGWPL